MQNAELIKSIMSDRPINCSKCNANLFYEGSGMYRCSECGNIEYDDFGKVKKYIDENGSVSMVTISEDTGVSIDKLHLMLRDGKVEIPEGSKYFINCEKCGCAIRYGRFCPDCVRKTAKELNQAFMVSQMGEKPKNTGTMRFYSDDKKSETAKGKFHR